MHYIQISPLYIILMILNFGIAWNSFKKSKLNYQLQVTKLCCFSIDWINYKYKPGMKLPSDEQKLIIDTAYTEKHNIVVNAVAGSGKTTTLLHIASALNMKNERQSILALLYNSRLKEETRQKRNDFELNNLEVHSYHAFAYRYYNAEDASTDKGLIRLVKSNLAPSISFSFDLIILDEVQDMTPLLYSFICKVMHDNLKPCRIIVLGDDRQNIFQFLEADSRYLTKAMEVFEPFNTLPWEPLKLQTSFRITQNIANFLNKNVLHYPLFKPIKPKGNKVMYFRGDPYEIVGKISIFLINLLKNNKCKESDIFILTPSTKSENPTPMKLLANELLRNGYQYYVPMSDESKLEDKVIKGKIVISSFHQSKGLERKVVVVFNFDQSYFKYYAKHENTDVVPNTLYVACTRAKDILILVGEKEETGALSFLRDIKNSSHLEVIDIGLKPQPKETLISSSNPNVLILTKYLSEVVLENAMKYLKYKEISSCIENIQLTSHVQTSIDRYEEVFDINGIALPALYESRTTKAMSTIQKYCLSQLKVFDDIESIGFFTEAEQDFSNSKISNYLRLATLYNYASSGYLNKALSIKDYDWMSNGEAERCLNVLKIYLSGDIKYEVKIEVQENRGLTGKRVKTKGRIDAITKDAIWELKCTNKLEIEHFLQLALYAWMSQNPNIIDNSNLKTTKKLFEKSRKFKLLNIRTGQVYELTSNYEELTAISEILIENYLKGDPKIEDDIFMEKVVQKRKKFIKKRTKLSQHRNKIKNKLSLNKYIIDSTTTTSSISVLEVENKKLKRTKKDKGIILKNNTIKTMS